MFSDDNAIIRAILSRRTTTDPARSLLVGISGIDGSGKGYTSQRLVAKLNSLGVNAIHLNVDPWLNLPHVRFAENNPAEHFYRNAIRFEEMFARLILPLKQNREISLVADYAEETASSYRPHLFEFENVDVIILEGIYLFQKSWLGHFDLTIWIDTSFETALKRAIRRGQEALSEEDTVRAYQTIYFPAQRLHFEIDKPRESAELILPNNHDVI